MDKLSAASVKPQTTVEAVVHDNYGKMLAALIYQFKDIELAEDSLQDAITSALDHWCDAGLPANPVAWIIKSAKHKAIDVIRRDNNFSNKQELLRATENQVVDMVTDEEIPDERLRLIFTCCHPALPEPSRIALTLKTLCNLSTVQIANAFLIQEKTVAQRLVRAKNKIKLAGIPYKVPEKTQWDERIASVMSVAYLIFNEGYYSVSEDKSLQVDLCREAMHIASMLLQLIPSEAEAAGLLALMYFHYARFPARLDSKGISTNLGEQDRTLWLQDYIISADKLLKTALMKGMLGPYQIQAAISAVHSHAVDFEQTDWKQITLLYEKLYQYNPSPVVELNAAVALSFTISPEAGLAALESINKNIMQSYQPFFAAKADMLNRAGKYKAARACYKQAIKLTENQADKKWLQRQLENISTKPS